MSRTALILFTCLATPTLLAQPKGEFIDGIIAVVEDSVVLQSQLDIRMQDIQRQIAADGGEIPPAHLLAPQVLDRLIIEEVQIIRAGQLGIVISDDILNQTVGRIARGNNFTLSEFIDEVESQGYNYPTIRESIRRDMLMTQVHQREVLSRIDITQREVEAFLASDEGQSVDNRDYLVSHIALRVEGAAPEDIERVRAVGESLLARLEAGEDFAVLARSHSSGQQALEGGDLGSRKITQLPSLFAERLVTMRPGQVSDLIRTTGSFHIIRLNDVRGDEERTIVAQTRARHILLRTNMLIDDSRAAARLSALREDILGGAEFAALARRFSEDPGSAINGGDLGWLEPGETARAFEEVMSALEPGVVSQPFQTQFGWHIVEVIDRREHDSTDDLRQNMAYRALYNRKSAEMTEEWLQRLRDEAFIEIRLDG